MIDESGEIVTALKDMTVKEAASKALEVICRQWHADYCKGSEWREPSTQSFDEYMYEADYVDEQDGDYSNLEANEDLWREVKYETGRTESVFDGWAARLVDEYGGEGQGDAFWVVISVSDGQVTRYFRKDGYYSSYGDGGSLDGETFEVTPKEKSVVVYE